MTHLHSGYLAVNGIEPRLLQFISGAMNLAILFLMVLKKYLYAITPINSQP